MRHASPIAERLQNFVATHIVDLSYVKSYVLMFLCPINPIIAGCTIDLAYVKSYVLMFLCRKKSHHRSIQKHPIRCGNVVFFYRFPQVIDTFWAFYTYIVGVFKQINRNTYSSPSPYGHSPLESGRAVINSSTRKRGDGAKP